MPVICQCGCGREIPYSYFHGRRYEPRFLQGHHTKTAGEAARRAQEHARKVAEMPTLICQCGCGETIPQKASHKYRAPKYIQSHYLKFGTHLRIERIREAKKEDRLAPPADWKVPSGLCECGCGGRTTVAKKSKSDRDQYAGYPLRYIQGHRIRTMERHPLAKTGRWTDKNGYIMIHMGKDGTGRSHYKPEHRLVYEQTHGVTLPPKVEVHHINGNKADNRPENLIATSKMEHRRAHQMANEVISLFLDERLYQAARAHFMEHGEVPELEALHQRLYAGQAAPTAFS